MNETITQPISDSFQNTWAGVIQYLPRILAALLILIIGVLLAVALARIVKRILAAIKLDAFIERIGLGNFLQRVDKRLSFSSLLAWLVKWFAILVVLIAVSNSLGLSQVTEFLNRVVLYTPNIIVAVIILLIGISVGNFLEQVIGRSLMLIQSGTSEAVSTVAKWAMIIFSAMIALVQLGIAPMLINTLLIGIIAMIAIAGGVAFGLGGRDIARDVLNRMRDDLTKSQGAG